MVGCSGLLNSNSAVLAELLPFSRFCEGATRYNGTRILRHFWVILLFGRDRVTSVEYVCIALTAILASIYSDSGAYSRWASQ